MTFYDFGKDADAMPSQVARGRWANGLHEMVIFSSLVAFGTGGERFEAIF